MGNQIRVDTQMVAQIATKIEDLNKKLNEELQNSKTTVNGLANIWEGEASQATISSFNEFANKYFQNYYDVVQSYVSFLRSNVDTGYTETETANKSLADAFK
ncbi:MAG: WXG100 family type VII secretion target [Clostridiales bacterium]|nr:WXG100 family type VII secretion target [Clostridiales bacterium]